MNGLWRYLYQENPMQIETLRSIRRFTVISGNNPLSPRTVAWLLSTVLGGIYLWLLVAILVYREDVSAEILWFEFVLLTLLLPGSLYAAISGERERLTWDSLILTNLSPARIITGKLWGRLMMATTVLVAFTIPLLLTHFVSRFQPAYTMNDLIMIQANMATWSLFLATFTLFVSARTKRSVATLTVVAMALLAFLGLIPGLMAVFGASAIVNPNTYVREYNPVLDYFGASPLHYLGGLMVHMNPGFVIGIIGNSGHEVASRDNLFPFVYTTPFVYGFLAMACIAGTLKALARLGLPDRTMR